MNDKRKFCSADIDDIIGIAMTPAKHTPEVGVYSVGRHEVRMIADKLIKFAKDNPWHADYSVTDQQLLFWIRRKRWVGDIHNRQIVVNFQSDAVIPVCRTVTKAKFR